MGWNQQARPDLSIKPKRARSKVMLLRGVGLVVVIATTAILVSWWADRRSEQRLWSLLPHAMGCVSNLGPMPNPPASVKAQQVRIEHLGAKRIAVTVTFSEPPPPAPVSVNTAYGEVRNQPGSLYYWLSIEDSHSDATVVVYSPSNGEPWQAVLISTESARNIGSDDRPEVPLAVSTSGNEVLLVLDLPGDAEHLSHQPFAPPIMINSSMSDRSELADAESIGILFNWQDCKWSTPVAATRDRPLRTLPPPVSAPPAQAPERQASAGFPADSKPCPQKYGATGAYTRSAIGNDKTSCPFAEEVRISYADMGVPGSVHEIKVLSPTTQQMYDVTCQPTGTLIVCTGGNGAVVYLN